MYYFNFTAKDSRFPDYMIDEYIGTPLINGYTTYYVANRYMIEARRINTGTYADALGVTSKYSGWRVPSVEDMRAIIGWTDSAYSNYNNYDVRTCGTSKELLNRILQYSGTFFTTLNVGDGTYVYAIHYNPNTNEANYAHALKTSYNYFLIIRDAN